ncbi:SgcJ/EcaC family oxidoreductase [Georgenia sp. EYE_87]|uniref:SgcJ/EcaC family oxidoreductase n=1 Tax=Georgenia sp. EYE_87 TaxID=2853448 RepID=UPI002003A04E|nr:SgcJ/EcaC family oxidoreductase [Georgenia sp. EYE_87]MCK6211458.1 SgcJ/EcaC family oxidoreductase [Georgenia sp. EYE_87]
MTVERNAEKTAARTGEDLGLDAASLAEIHELVRRAQDAQFEPGPFLDLHTPDAVVVNIAGRRVLGRDALGEAMRAALTSPLRDVVTTAEVHDVRLVAPGVALVSCTKRVEDARPEPAAGLPTVGVLTYVVVRSQGRWRIASAQTTPVVQPG